MAVLHDAKDQYQHFTVAIYCTVYDVQKLADLVPGAVSAVVSTFATPLLRALAGPVTKAVLERINRQ